LNDDQRRRLAVKGRTLGRSRLAELATIVTPDTILRWHRLLVARKRDYSGQRKSAGRPPTEQTIAELTVKMARENPTWGYEVWTKNGLVTYFVLFVIDLVTRHPSFEFLHHTRSTHVSNRLSPGKGHLPRHSSDTSRNFETDRARHTYHNAWWRRPSSDCWQPTGSEIRK